MSKHAAPSRRGSRSGGLLLAAAGTVASLVLALSVSGTFSAYTAAITNTKNSANTVSISMTQGPNSSTVACSSTPSATAECTTDMYVGKNLRPGDATAGTSTVFANTSDTDASSFSLVPSTCSGTTSDANSICNWLLVSVSWTTTSSGTTSTSTVISKVKAASIAGTTYTIPSPPKARTSGTMVVQVQLDPAAPNGSQGQTLGQTLTWTFTA